MAKTSNYADINGKNKKASKLATFLGKKSAFTAEGGQADYATATPAWVMAAIIAVTSQGGAMQFGYSRDGGVYTIVILMDGEMDKNYVKQSEGIDNFLEQVYTAFTADGSTE